MNHQLPKSLLTWLTQQLTNTVSAGSAPDRASISEIAHVMSLDAFGRPDSEKRLRANSLLNSPALKARHIVLGWEPKKPIVVPPFLWKFSPDRVETLQEEVKRKSREAIESRKLTAEPELVEVKGLLLIDLLRFKDGFLSEGLWSNSLDRCFNAETVTRPANTESTTAATVRHSMDDMSSKVTEILDAAGVTADQAMKKSALKSAIMPVLIMLGYSAVHLEIKFRSLHKWRLNGSSLTDGADYFPGLVVNYLVKNLTRISASRAKNQN